MRSTEKESVVNRVRDGVRDGDRVRVRDAGGTATYHFPSSPFNTLYINTLDSPLFSYKVSISNSLSSSYLSTII